MSKKTKRVFIDEQPDPPMHLMTTKMDIRRGVEELCKVALEGYLACKKIIEGIDEARNEELAEKRLGDPNATLDNREQVGEREARVLIARVEGKRAS